MYRVFNMGHRMEICLDPADAATVIDVSRSFGIEAQVIGHVEECPQKELIIRSEAGEFRYGK
jgi:phosphoribosylformylglycinamidine cyclo-ligase